MGLETVELVMEIEEEFKIKIDDREAERLQTVGEAYAFVLGALGWQRQAPCRSQAAFYRVRQAMMTVMSQERKAIRPGAKLEELVPSSGRWESWKRLGESLDVRLPELHWPVWAVTTCVVVAMIVAAYTGYATLPVIPKSAGLCAVIAFVVSALVGCFGMSLFPHVFQRALPLHLATVGDLTKTVMWQEYKPGSLNEGSPTTPELDDDIWPRLQHIICDTLGVEPEQVQPHAYFVKDLGCD